MHCEQPINQIQPNAALQDQNTQKQWVLKTHLDAPAHCCYDLWVKLLHVLFFLKHRVHMLELYSRNVN